jgi:hypothetical protein
MESVTRNVRDIEGEDRRALEHVLGRHLSDNDQVIIQVVPPGGATATGTQMVDSAPSDQLPDWCNVYEGLSEEEIDDLESIIKERANLTRPSE